MRACHYCGTTERSLRPYGPGGAFICLPCGHETPERLAETDANMALALELAEAASPDGVVFITDDGPMPGNLTPDALDRLIDEAFNPPEETS